MDTDGCFPPRRIHLKERNGDGMGKKKQKTEQKVIVVRPGVLNHADADRFEKACEAYLKKVTKTKETAQKPCKSWGSTHKPDASPNDTGRIAPPCDGFRARIPRVRQVRAERLLAGEPFQKSINDYDWLGHGIYFWEANPLCGLE